MWHTPRFPGRILFSPGDRSRNGLRRSSHRRRSAVFRLERLEERTVLSTLTVLNSLDSGAGSLRDTIAAASPGDTIVFAKDVHRITLTSGELDITQNLDIEGPGPNKLTVSGKDHSRVFDISSGTTVTIARLTITDGLANGNTLNSPSTGGGVLNQGTLNLDNDVLSNNQAVGAPGVSAGGFKGGALGGAIETFGPLTVTGCEFINNQALGASGSLGNVAGIGGGGAIHIFGTARPTVNITDSMFAGNVARGGNDCGFDPSTGDGRLTGLGDGGAILNGATLIVINSTFSHN